MSEMSSHYRPESSQLDKKRRARKTDLTRKRESEDDHDPEMAGFHQQAEFLWDEFLSIESEICLFGRDLAC